MPRMNEMPRMPSLSEMFLYVTAMASVSYGTYALMDYGYDALFNRVSESKIDTIEEPISRERQSPDSSSQVAKTAEGTLMLCTPVIRL